jgi:hypothetical protein
MASISESTSPGRVQSQSRIGSGRHKTKTSITIIERITTATQFASAVSINEPLFHPFPSEIVFQDYQPYDIYETTLSLRNNDKVLLK